MALTSPSSEGVSLRRVEIESHIVESDETLLDHYRGAIARKLPTIHVKPEHTGVWVVAAGGPSLKNELRALKKHKKRGHKIVSVNGSHDYLIQNGIKPDYMIMVDPKQSNKHFVETPKKGVTYLIGASCHPDVFDALEGYDLKVWYPVNGAGEDDLIASSPVQIGGGPTVGLRAVNIGYVLGYREIHLYGMDGCLKDSKHHAYPQPENDEKIVMDIIFLGEVYYCHTWMAKQAEFFIEFMKQNKYDMKIKVHSPGLLKHIESHFNQRT